MPDPVVQRQEIVVPVFAEFPVCLGFEWREYFFSPDGSLIKILYISRFEILLRQKRILLNQVIVQNPGNNNKGFFGGSHLIHSGLHTTAG